MEELITLSKDVAEALENNKAIIALESTLIAHGFPYPDNYNLAIELEDQLRDAGIVPATIAIINGEIKVGLSRDELEYIATADDIRKASLRDIPMLLAKKLSGGTTVASTMQIAGLVGIKVFVTGGIGGVHRGGENTMDISADLQALSKYNVIVVCAGAKSVLDLPKTREMLETLGVPVLGYKYDKFPAFYLRDSGLEVDYRIDKPEEIREAIFIKSKMNIPGGLVVTTPVPEEDELDAVSYNKALDKLIKETVSEGIKGKELTPYLLKRLKEETGGESVKSNIALIKNNLAVGCEIALALQKS